MVKTITIWVKVFCIQLGFSLNKLEKPFNQHKNFNLLQIYFDICARSNKQTVFDFKGQNSRLPNIGNFRCKI